MKIRRRFGLSRLSEKAAWWVALGVPAGMGLATMLPSFQDTMAAVLALGG